MFPHAALQSLPLCFLSEGEKKKQPRKQKKHHVRLCVETFFLLPSSKVAGNAAPAVCHMNDPQL